MADTFYVGTYTGKSKGIYLCQLSATGAITIVDTTGGVSNPSFLALHPSKRFLYAACETYAAGGGTIAAFAIEGASGKLSPLNTQSAKGQGPCHVAVDHHGRYVAAANYGDGTVVCLPIQPDGRLGPATGFQAHKGSSVNKSRQNEPHAHSINFDPDDHFAVACDLGTDRAYIYRFDAGKGTLTPNDPPSVELTPGAGPRHFAFHPNKRFAYAINELNNTVTAFLWDGSKGRLETIESVTTLPDGFSGESYTAEVQVHPSGQFLLGSNRGHDSLAVFAIDGRTGKLKLLGVTPTGGKNPRHFGISPKGDFVLAAHQNTDNITVLRFDARTGKLTPTGQSVEIPAAVCVRFV
ncbi:MAG: lactonase family protein [Capsulimonadales bacterium]|nr:lactonase family protein [Capsulimonadales bacterium]